MIAMHLFFFLSSLGTVLFLLIALTIIGSLGVLRAFCKHNDEDMYAVNTGLNGIHDAGLLPRFATAPIAEKYLLAKRGADQNTLVICTGVADFSQGVVSDEAKYAGDPVNLASHAGADGTRLVRVDVAVNQDDELVPSATGRAVKLVGQAPATYYPFGRAITGGAPGDVIEYAPCPPIPRIVT